MKTLFMIRKPVVAACLAVALILGLTVAGDASKIQSLRMEKQSGSSSFILSKMGAVDVQEFMMEDPPRLVLDLMGAQHELSQNKFDGDGVFVAQVRTSQFTNDPDQITRVVFDLTKEAGYDVANSDQSVTVRFFAKGTTPKAIDKPRTMTGSVAPMGMADSDPAMDIQPIPPKNTIEAASEQPAQPAAKAEPKPQPKPEPKPASPVPAWKPTTEQPAAQPSTQGQKQASAPVKSQPAKQQPAVAWNKASSTQRSAAPSTMTSGTRQMQSYGSSAGLVRNKNITIDVQNADIKTVLRSMSEFSSTNIISGPEVEGKVTAHLKNVPWRQALDIVLKSHGFGWREEYGVIRVSTIEKLTKEELELQEAERRKDSLLPLETQIITLSYANAGEMKKALEEVLTERGSMEIEAGNNALIVSDIPKNLDKVAAMVAELDRKIKQVEIVAKMVDVDFEASQEMGIRWDVLNLNVNDVNGVADAVIDARSTTPTGTFRVGTVQSWGQVQSIVDMLARENKANIISNPRIVTADNREASILVGKEIPLIVSDEAGNPITELTKVGIILRVTPHVNQDNSITLDLHPEVSELSSQATVQGGVIISLSEADTRLVVNDGETAVMGGLINEVETTLENGVPVLKDLPVLGNLFKLRNKTNKKRELIIFVTPRIVDNAMAQN